MNHNILTYTIYLAITMYIIFAVGQICYKNGNVFVLALIPGHQELCTRINRMLLIGYYLVNIGYAATALASWEIVTDYARLVETIAKRVGMIVAILTLLHYLNIFLITKYVNKLIT